MDQARAVTAFRWPAQPDLIFPKWQQARIPNFNELIIYWIYLNYLQTKFFQLHSYNTASHITYRTTCLGTQSTSTNGACEQHCSNSCARIDTSSFQMFSLSCGLQNQQHMFANE